MNPRKMFIAMLGILGLTLASGVFVFYWSSQNLEKSALGIAKLKSENDVLDIRLAAIDSAQAKLNELSDIREDVTNILPPEKIQSDIIAQLLAIAANNGITLNNITFPNSTNPANFALSQTDPLPGVGGVRYTTVTTDFTTTYPQLLDFMGDIEKNQRLMQLSNINISPNTNNTYGINIGIQIYVKG